MINQSGRQIPPRGKGGKKQGAFWGDTLTSRSSLQKLGILAKVPDVCGGTCCVLGWFFVVFFWLWFFGGVCGGGGTRDQGWLRGGCPGT